MDGYVRLPNCTFVGGRLPIRIESAQRITSRTQIALLGFTKCYHDTEKLLEHCSCAVSHIRLDATIEYVCPLCHSLQRRYSCATNDRYDSGSKVLKVALNCLYGVSDSPAGLARVMVRIRLLQNDRGAVSETACSRDTAFDTLGNSTVNSQFETSRRQNTK